MLINYQGNVCIIFFVFTVIVLVFLFKKKRIYPKLAIALIVVGICLSLATILISGLVVLKASNTEIVQSVIKLMP